MKNKSIAFRRNLMAAIIAVGWTAFLLSFNTRPIGPTWRGITVGRSTWLDVIDKLGDPTVSDRVNWDTRILYYRESPYEWAVHKITLRDGVVASITENAGDYRPLKIYLKDYVSQYGIPEYVFWSSESKVFRGVLFLSQGVLVIATAVPYEESQMVEAYYFRPCALTCVLFKFSDKIAVFDPAPDSDIIGTRDPWNIH